MRPFRSFVYSVCFEFFGDETFRDISHNREKENRETERKRDFDFLKKIFILCCCYWCCLCSILLIWVELERERENFDRRENVKT